MDSSVTKIPCKLDTFFKYWLLFTAPLHKLRNKDMKILASILKKRYELSYIITDDTLIDSYLFSKEIKEQIIQECEETPTGFSVILSSLRAKGIIEKGNKINKKFIPELSKDSKKFDFMVIFDINDSK